MVAFGVAGEFPLFDFFFITTERLKRIGFQVGIRLHKLGDKRVKKAQQIVNHQNLAITMRARPDADGGD